MKRQERCPWGLRFGKEETWSTDGKTATAKAIAVFLPCGMISDTVVPGQFKSETAFIIETGVPRETPVSERKKETADVELSRHLRKPEKRNAAGFF